MIELLIDDLHPLVLPENAQVTLVRTNNFWREEADFSFEYSTPFELPYCDTNAHLLGFPHHINTHSMPTLQATLYIRGNVRYRGTLLLLESSMDGYSVALVRKTEWDMGKKLSEVCTLTFDAPDAETDLDAQVAAGTALPYNWPQIINYATSEIEKYKLDADWDHTYINYYHGTAEQFDNDSPLSPQFFLSYTLRTIFSYYKQAISSSWLTHPQVQRYMLMNTNNINNAPPYDRSFLFTINSTNTTEIYFRVDTVYFLGEYNQFKPYAGDSFTFTIYRFAPGTTTSPTADTVSYTVDPSDVDDPDTFYTHLFAAIQAVNSNYRLEGKFLEQDNPTLLISYYAGAYWALRIENTYVQSVYSKNVPVVPIVQSFTGGDISMANHMPDMTVAEFFTALKDGFNLAMFWDPRGEQCVIEPKRNLLTYQVWDCTPYVLAHPVVSEKETPYYAISYEIDKYENKYVNYSGAVTLNPGRTRTDAKALNIAMGRPVVEPIGSPNGNSGAGRMPITEAEIGTYTALVSCPMRLIYWQGLAPDTLGKNYPKADDTSLAPDELYETWWGPYLDYLYADTRRVRARLRIPPEVLATVDPRYRWRMHGIDHVWIDVRETYTHNDVEVEVNMARL